MPFMPDPPASPSPPPPTSIKFSRVRELRASIMPSSKRIPPPLPSPSVYDDGDDGAYDGQQQLGSTTTTTTVVGAGKPRIVDVERGGGAVEATKRKTLFQRALEGWWDLPGLLSRGDTVRAKARPFPSGRKERTVAEGGFL